MSWLELFCPGDNVYWWQHSLHCYFHPNMRYEQYLPMWRRTLKCWGLFVHMSYKVCFKCLLNQLVTLEVTTCRAHLPSCIDCISLVFSTHSHTLNVDFSLRKWIYQVNLYFRKYIICNTNIKSTCICYKLCIN